MDVPVGYYVCRVICLNTIKGTRHRNTEIKDVCRRRYRMICFTSSLIGQLYHFATDFDRVLLQLVGTDIENSLFKYRVSYRHLAVMIETFGLLMKSCGKK